MRVPELNRPAISKPIRNLELDIRVYATPNYRYIDQSKSILKASQDNVIFRYAKNFSKDGTYYSLLLISKEINTTKVNNFLKDMSEKIKTKNKIVEPDKLTYLDDYYGG